MLDTELLAGVQSRLATELEAIIGRNARVALVDYPYSKNSGDAAIWLGERQALRHLGAQIVYACETESYDAAALAARLGEDGIILCHGGGNFGDYWPQHQRFREKVLRDFPDQRVIQLPQSIGLRSPRSSDALRSAMAWHEGFVVLCRDQESVRLATGPLALKSFLVPDGAFGLGPMGRPGIATRDLLLLARTDHERAFDISAAFSSDVEVSDWSLSGSPHTMWKTAKIPPKILRPWRHHRLVDRAGHPLKLAAYDRMASVLVRAAARQLSRYRVVVTDRLHAHVLCTLLGIPHVVLDNSYGKIRGLHDAWLSGSASAYFADDPTHARKLATELLSAL